MSETWAQTQVLRLASLIIVLAFALIVLAGLDLGANGVGAFAAPSMLDTSIGASHLVVSLLTATATVFLVALCWLRLRDHTRVLQASILALVLIVVQVLSISASESATLAPWAASTHFGATALLLATAIVLAISERPVPRFLVARTAFSAELRGTLPWLVVLSAGMVFAVMLSGAYLGASGTQRECSGWPLCGVNGGSVALADPQNVHRLLVGGSGLLIVALAVGLIRAGASIYLPAGLLLVFATEAGVGAFAAGGSESPLISGTHFGAAAIAWMLLVVLGLTIRPSAAHIASTGATATGVWSATARDYLRVTKPGIMILLLITTLGAMLIAPGWPSIWLVAATLLGGALASGGASALNCYLDRDIDVVMARTRRRPIPTGTLSPEQVRNFGLFLLAAAVIVLWVLVNPVASMLALSGGVFYVVIYTRFLKRSTPQNIVIGGAAGAFPPLVGWAAVTGTVSLTSILLFALIYYWTPPHFWSLALLKARDYERAGIPMLPVTHGDHQTRQHILLYSFMLVAISILAVPAGIAGLLYLVVAVALGAMFVWLAARMFIEGTPRLAWRLFKYSNYYLAALLLAMVIDRALIS